MTSELLIGERRFTLHDQDEFAALSGDINPIHIDVVEARKTLTGQCVVHGINGLLWALDCVAELKTIHFKNIRVKFLRPIFVDSPVSCCWDPDAKTICLKTDEKTVCYFISYAEHDSGISLSRDKPLPDLAVQESPRIFDFSTAKVGVKNKMKSGGEKSSLDFMYANLFARCGENRIYEVALLSNIVGMQVPGMHSLFLSCHIDLIDEGCDSNPTYQIENIDTRFGLITVGYSGVNIKAVIRALERPHYEPPKIGEIERHMPSRNFLAGRSALIIGGSRGVGEAVAKAMALAGAAVTLTFSRGASDALRVSDEINAATGLPVDVRHLDVRDQNQLRSFSFEADILCYFASPKILPSDLKFDDSLFKDFKLVYCDAFDLIAARFISKGGSAIFWPSTAFLNGGGGEFKEYLEAKKMGEELCEMLSTTPDVSVFFPRLEKVATDQTVDLLQSKALDTAEVAVEIVKTLQSAFVTH